MTPIDGASRKPLLRPVGNTPIDLLALCVTLLAGGVLAWCSRFAMNPDGLSYLDLAQGWLHGKWDAAVNSSWPPLYPMVLAVFLAASPDPFWEFPLAHAASVVILMCSFLAFRFLLAELLALRAERVQDHENDFLPEPEARLVGYSVFLVCSLCLAPGYSSLQALGPGLLQYPIVFLATGLALRAWRGRNGWAVFVFLGVALGLAYLAKSIFLYLAPLFFLAAARTLRSPKVVVARLLVAAVPLAALVVPYVAAVSHAEGRFTMGDSGKINYGLFVTGQLSAHDRSTVEDPRTGVFEFVSYPGTYPPHYHRTRWEDPTKVTFSLRKQLCAWVRNAGELLREMLDQPLVILTLMALLMLLLRPRDVLPGEVAWDASWIVLPSLAGLAAYATILILRRYVALYLGVIFTVFFSLARLPVWARGKRMPRCIAATIAIPVCLVVGGRLAMDLGRSTDATHQAYAVAQAAVQRGVVPGSRVCTIGLGFEHYWASPARTKIAAEIADADRYWGRQPCDRGKVHEQLAGLGIRFLVARSIPPGEPGERWVALGHGHFLFDLKSPANDQAR